MIDVRPLDADGYCKDNALIEINRHLSPEKTAIAICHELIHWKQYQDTGEFDEEDAYSREEELCQEYINSLCLLYTSPSPRDGLLSRMPSSA